MNNNKIILICKGVLFYSENDENAFFEWIKKFEHIERFWGKGNELYLEFANNDISIDKLIELTALFARYKIDLNQLAVFKNEINKELFEIGIAPHENVYPESH